MSKKSGLHILILLEIVLFIVGIALIVVAHNNQHNPLLHDLTRDIGIAFLVSALVTIAYETYARTTFDLAKISSLLETVYGSGVPPRVWERIKETLLKRELIRRDAIVHLRVTQNRQTVSQDDLILDIDLEYKLQSLQSKAKDFVVSHGLDEHITNTGLPRFVYASVGSESASIDNSSSWKSQSEHMRVSNGRLDLDVHLRPFGENYLVPLRIRRQEVRECPGSYYLIMTEVTDGLKVYLDECDENVSVELIIRPTERDVRLEVGGVEIVDEPLLPGHGMEFKLTRRETTGTKTVNSGLALG
jgi:hypothetical protein